MTSVSKNVYIQKLDDIVNKYSNTYHSEMKMKLVDVKSDTYIDFNKENNEADSKFEVGEHVRISKRKNNSAKSYTPNWSEEVFMVRKVKGTVSWASLVILTVNKLLERFMKKNNKKQIKKRLELKKLSREEVIEHMLNGNIMTIFLTVGLIY